MNLHELYQEATTPADRSACPPPDAFLGKVGDDVVTHIARCSACAREYRMARAFRRFETPPPRRLPWMLAAAAVLVAIVASLLAWRAPRPQIGTPIVDLETVRGPADNIVDVPKGASLVTLILHLPEPAAHADLELIDAAGRVTWRGTWSAPRAESSLTVTLSAPDGDYTLRTGAAAFRFRVRHGG